MHWFLITCFLILGFASLIISTDAQTSKINIVGFGAIGDGIHDDSNAILNAWERACGTEGSPTVVIPRKKTFLVTKLNLNGPCKAQSIAIQFLGKIIAPSKDAWVSDRSSWIQIANVNGLTINANGGTIDGQGFTWWKTCNKTCARPISLQFNGCNNLIVNSLIMRNSPGAHISVSGCEGAIFSHMNIKAPGKSPNTDGFDIANSKNITIQDSTLAIGDDCIAINGGSSFINATRLFCGPGHGISIGSLGRNNSYETVEDVYVYNCSFIGTTNGARIKTWPGGSGYARRITFDQIILKDTENAIIIDQYYGYKTLSQTGESAVQVSEVTYRGFNGTSSGDNAINIKCSPSGCSNLTFDQIYIVSSQPNKPASAFCENFDGTIGDTVPKISCNSESPQAHRKALGTVMSQRTN